MVCDRTHIELRHACNQTGHPFRVRWVWPETAHSFAELTLFICEMADPAGDVWQMGSAMWEVPLWFDFFSNKSANESACSILVIPGNCLACWSYIPLACEATHRHQLKYEDHVMSRAKHTKCAYHWSELARLVNQSANGTHWFCGTEPEICFLDQTCMASS